MKVALLAVGILTTALPVFAQTPTTLSLTYNPSYDNPGTPISCQVGQGIIPVDFVDIGSLPGFPKVGSLDPTTWEQSGCLTCWNVTYGDSSIYITAVALPTDGYQVSEEAMNALTGGLAAEIGRIDVVAVEIDESYCGL